MKRRAVVGLGLASLACIVAGCRKERASRQETGPRRVRVVSLSPSTTEAMFAIGAGSLLVGRSQHCDYPAEALALPVVGGYGDPNLEVVLALAPDVVIGERGPAGPSLAQQLQAHRIETLFPASNSLADIAQVISKLGRRFDRQAGATTVVGAIDRDVAHISRWARQRGKPSVLMVFDAQPLFVAGPGSYPDELIAKAGGRNVVTEGGSWPTLDLERLLSLDPDVIIDAIDVQRKGPSVLLTTAGWQTIRARREGKIRRLSESTALRPGPRIALGLAAIATAIHGAAPPAVPSQAG